MEAIIITIILLNLILTIKLVIDHKTQCDKLHKLHLIKERLYNELHSTAEVVKNGYTDFGGILLDLIRKKD